MPDLKTIDGKFYDFDPHNNPSFIQTAAELKELGIKNYYFMLEIKDPRVININPFNPKITKPEMQLVLAEAWNNIWYFARCIARIRSQKGVVRFALHRGLCAAIWCFTKRMDSCLCEPRQTWKTSGIIAAVISWAFQLSHDLNIHFFGKDQENTKRNLKILQDCITVLPKWMQFTLYRDEYGKVKKTRQSTEILVNELRRNTTEIHAKASNESAATQMARGASAAMLYFDEIEFTPFFDFILANSAPAFKTAADNARDVGLPYGRLFSTTPGNLDTREGQTAYPIIESMIPWTEKMYDMTDEEISLYKSAFREDYHSDVSKERSRDVVDIIYIEYKYYQIRKDYQWVEEQLKLTGNVEIVRREIFLERLRGSKDSPIAPEDIDFLIHNCKDSTDLIINNRWRFLVYDHGVKQTPGAFNKLFDEKIPYIVGIDPAGGEGGDNTAIMILNPNNLQIAATFKSPYITSVDLEALLITLVKKYIPSAVLIPERNSMGIFLIQHLCQSTIRDNLYWSDNNKQFEKMAEEDPDSFDLKLQTSVNRKYGTFLSKKVRDAMIRLLFKMINECRELLTVQYLVDDICKLVKTSSGKIEAAQGAHDDCLFAYLHTLYLYYTGDNLELFGIDNSQFNSVNDPLADEEEDAKINLDDNKELSYEEIAVQEIMKDEERSKYLVSKFDFIDDKDFNYVRKEAGDKDNSYSISPVFFDMINGLDEF